MFNKKKTPLEQVLNLTHKAKKPSNTKRNIIIGAGAAVVTGIAGAFVKSKDGGQ